MDSERNHAYKHKNTSAKVVWIHKTPWSNGKNGKNHFDINKIKLYCEFVY